MTIKELCVKAKKECGYLNFYNDVTALMKKYNIKCVNDLEAALKEKEQQDGVIQILKEIIEFSQVSPHIEPSKDNGFHIMSAVGINIQRDIENKERELLRKWILETCFPKELKALKIIKEKNVCLRVFRHYFCDKHNPYCNSYKYYLKNVDYFHYLDYKEKLTETEFNLLKEYLK